jgi:phage terminase small subunit
VLGLRLLKRGYVAKYMQGQAFVVLEATPESAAEVLKKLKERFDGATPAQIGDEAFQAKAPYLEGICVFRKGRYVAGYANLPETQQAATLAAKLATRIP